MIQCVVCEDWLHGRHTGPAPPPPDTAYAEMVCAACLAQFPFLRSYAGLAVNRATQGDQQDEVEVEDKPQEKAESDQKAGEMAGGSGGPCSSHAAPANLGCTRSAHCPPITGSLFFPDGWRAGLCRCSACLELHNTTNTAFLLTAGDTVAQYEAIARQERGGQDTLEQGMQALSGLDRVKQVEAIHSYNNMKDNLMEYLSKFANNKKVVREEDIKEFFEVGIETYFLEIILSNFSGNEKQQKENPRR